jgi:hypothetical protein
VNGNGHSADLVEQLESLSTTEPPTFMELMERLYRMRYTGPCTLHFAGGLPRQVVLDQPIRVALDAKKA